MGETRIAQGPFVAQAASGCRAGLAEGQLQAFAIGPTTAFPRHRQDCLLYRPAGTRPERPLPVTIFLDGPTLLREWHVDIMLDTLIADGLLPPMAAIFIESGHDIATDRDDQAARTLTRSIEYDSVDGRYARLLLEDVLPHAAQLGALTQDRAIAGASSGALCAFNAAWHHPGDFGRVLGAIGSFVNIRGGHVYPDRVRATPHRPLRIFLQEGTADRVASYPDLDWPAGNRAMQAALEASGYDHRFVWGDGGHDLAHSAALLPEAMQWLWRAS